MQSQFSIELKMVSGQVKSRRGTPLTSADRATNIAKSSCNVAKLNVTSQVQANNLAKLGTHAKFLGNGLAVIDYGSRVGNIYTIATRLAATGNEICLLNRVVLL